MKNIIKQRHFANYNLSEEISRILTCQLIQFNQFEEH